MVGGNEIAYIGAGSENEFVMPPMTHFAILIVNILYNIYNGNQRDETKRQRARTKCQNNEDHYIGS